MVDGGARLQSDCFADQIDGCLVPAELRNQDTEQLEGIGDIWIDRQNPAIDAFGVLQTAGAVKLGRLFDGLLDVHGAECVNSSASLANSGASHQPSR